MPMALYPMRGQRAIFTPPPLPMRSLSLHAQAAGDTWLKAGASADEAHASPTASVAIVADTPCRADMALRAPLTLVPFAADHPGICI